MPALELQKNSGGTILCLNALTGITGKTKDHEVHGVRTLTRITKKSKTQILCLSALTRITKMLRTRWVHLSAPELEL